MTVSSSVVSRVHIIADCKNLPSLPVFKMRPFLQLVVHALLAFNLVFAADLAHDVPARYYSMSPYSSYLDGRFAQPERLSNFERHEILGRTVRRFLSAMKEIKVTVWLAHEALLGWHWGQKILPWDTDIDVHIHYNDLRFLAAYHNMTIYKDWTSAEYLLDINPNFRERRRTKDPDNFIDARWIDMTTGLFVDITAVSDVQRDSENGVQYLLAKDGHNYRKDAVMPLNLSTFEMEEVYVPRDASAILAHEYGEDSLERTLFQGLVEPALNKLYLTNAHPSIRYKFDPDANRWEAIETVSRHLLWLTTYCQWLLLDRIVIVIS